MLSKNPEKRLGSSQDVHEVLSHPWFADLDISKIESESIEPPLKPDVKAGQVDFKYFNLKQQTTMDSFLPAEKQQKVKDNKDKFKNFDQL